MTWCRPHSSARNTTGTIVGDVDGASVGDVGVKVGMCVGTTVGEDDGPEVGPAVGAPVVGPRVGPADGARVGGSDGDGVGPKVGGCVGVKLVGESVGAGVSQPEHVNAHAARNVGSASHSSAQSGWALQATAGRVSERSCAVARQSTGDAVGAAVGAKQFEHVALHCPA